MLWNSSTATNLTLSWQPPQQTRRSFFQYAVNCTPLAEGLPVPGTVTTAFGETTARLTNLEEGSSYECSVYAQIDGYLSEAATITSRTMEIGICLAVTVNYGSYSTTIGYLLAIASSIYCIF